MVQLTVTGSLAVSSLYEVSDLSRVAHIGLISLHPLQSPVMYTHGEPFTCGVAWSGR